MYEGESIHHTLIVISMKSHYRDGLEVLYMFKLSLQPQK